jgi:hypothetical protein
MDKHGYMVHSSHLSILLVLDLSWILLERGFAEDAAILCPCSRYINLKSMAKSDVEMHILLNGMSSTYIRWIHHGEGNDVHVLEEAVHVDAHSNPVEHDNNAADRFDSNAADRVEDVLRDLIGVEVPCNDVESWRWQPIK